MKIIKYKIRLLEWRNTFDIDNNNNNDGFTLTNTFYQIFTVMKSENFKYRTALEMQLNEPGQKLWVRQRKIFRRVHKFDKCLVKFGKISGVSQKMLQKWYFSWNKLVFSIFFHTPLGSCTSWMSMHPLVVSLGNESKAIKTKNLILIIFRCNDQKLKCQKCSQNVRKIWN